MIINDRLACWLTDEDGQARTVAGMEAAGADFCASAPVADLRGRIEAPNLSAATILDAARRFMDRWPEVAASVRPIIEALSRDPYFRPPLKGVSSPVHAGLLLVDKPLLTILAAVTSPDSLAAKRTGRTGRASITFNGERSLFKFLKSGGATLSFWECPTIVGGFSAEAAGCCRMVGRRSIEDGETIPVDGRRQSFVIEHAAADIVYLQAATPVDAAPFSIEYDCDTLAFVGAASTDDAGSRLQMMVSLLRILGRHDTSPLFRALLRDADFHLRWHVMREFLALDADGALPDLAEMARSDPHPNVRLAAAQTMKAFFELPAIESEEEKQLCPA